MTGLDAGFLYMETPTLHMHTLKIAVIDPSGVSGGYSFDLLKQVLGTRLKYLPPFRRRVVEVPFGLTHPVWIEDPDFDLDYHVRRVAVPAPGGPRELGELISDIASHQLDRRRPLWELWVVEGLEHGHIGVVAKIHHAAADGEAAAAMLAAALGVGEGEAEATDPWRPDPVPSEWQLFVGAVRSIAIALAHLPRLLWHTLQGMVRLIQRRRAGGDLPPPPFSAPAVSFNRALTPHRRFVFSSLPLDDVKEVKNALGATVNDVVLALSGAALRRYLQERDELPARPLMAGVPVSVGEMGTRSSGNRVSNLFTSIPTDVADPVERVRTVHRMMQGAKEVHNALGAEMLSDWTELTPPRPFAAFMRFYSRRELASRVRPPINVVISNVPGPTAPLDIAGARLVSIYSMGPILEGIGLNITVWSYCGSLNFGIVSCRELMPDLWRLTDYIQDALEELKKAVASEGESGGKNT
ncbi:MAG: wax ester/triacylglycerol synthase family O-acyltransferase [Acidimicrobiia bacterium]|nr:wax ester/triacylglycerol synthase family O-acyltransferase [Acidimicrobiia bacterium]